MFRTLGLLVLLAAPAMWAGDDVDAAWKGLQSLAGEWKGSGDKFGLSYAVVSGGSMVMERMTMPSPQPDMITMYHRDGKGLVATHYCSIGNQPRMRAAQADAKTIRFRFADITNLTKPDGGHIRHLTVTFEDKNHLTQEWTSSEGGKEHVETFKWTRK